MKIIDADKLHYKTVRIATQKGIKPALVVFAKEIQKMPKIVLCRDCKYCDRGNCTFWDDGYGAIVSMDSFCSWGERGRYE